VKALRLLPGILLSLLLCTLAHAATPAAAIDNSTTHLSSQTVARVAPWIALNQGVMQRLALARSNGTVMAKPPGTPCLVNTDCRKNEICCNPCEGIFGYCPQCILAKKCPGSGS